MKIADDFDAIAKRLRELNQAKAEEKGERLTPPQQIFKWAKMIEAATKARDVAEGRPLMTITARRIVPP